MVNQSTTELAEQLRIKKQALFLEKYSNCGNISTACREAGIGRATYYEWIKEYPEFAHECHFAEQIAADKIHAELWRRGIEGYDEPLSFQGRLTGDVVRKYSDKLAIELARAHDPRFRHDQNVNVRGAIGVALVDPDKIRQMINEAHDQIEADDSEMSSNLLVEGTTDESG